MSRRTEYRVRWQREDRSPSYRIYQSFEAATRKVDAIVATEEVKHAVPRLASLPDLVEPPVIQTRRVGDWEDGERGYEPSEIRVREAAGTIRWQNGVNDTVAPVDDLDLDVVPF